MTPEELLSEWEEGGTGLRPKRIQALRSELREATGLFIPHRTSEIESWQRRFRGQVTRALRERVAEEEE